MHLMHLQPKDFLAIKDGTKRVEFRLFDSKRRLISIGDTVTFENSENSEKVEVKIVDMIVDTSFANLVNKFTPEMMAVENEEEVLVRLNEFYPLEQQTENAVVAIVFKLLK